MRRQWSVSLFHCADAVVVLTQGYKHESGGNPKGQRVALLLLVDSTLLGWKEKTKKGCVKFQMQTQETSSIENKVRLLKVESNL